MQVNGKQNGFSCHAKNVKKSKHKRKQSKEMSHRDRQHGRQTNGTIIL